MNNHLIIIFKLDPLYLKIKNFENKKTRLNLKKNKLKGKHIQVSFSFFSIIYSIEFYVSSYEVIILRSWGKHMLSIFVIKRVPIVTSFLWIPIVFQVTHICTGSFIKNSKSWNLDKWFIIWWETTIVWLLTISIFVIVDPIPTYNFI